MLRPTPAETILGIQRTVTEILVPELRSPFAIGQAATAAGVLMFASMWLQAFPKYDAGEIEDLKHTFDLLRARAGADAESRAAIETGVRACDETPADRRGMEAAMSELACGVAVGKIAGPVADEVRGYLRRHLERIRTLFGSSSPFG